MKLLCINAKPMAQATNVYIHLIKEGNSYTLDHINQVGSYVLVEVKDGQEDKYGPIGFHEDRFIPISNIDETEFIREYNTQQA